METLVKKYQDLKLNETLHFEKFNLIAISHHSTKIEGSSLTELESEILIDYGLTPNGKPLNDSLMVRDYFNALKFILNEVQNKRPLSVALIQEINARVMNGTGGIYNTVFGEIDVSKGMFRKGNVSAGKYYFPNYDKVEKLITEMVENSNEKMKGDISFQEKINLSFDVHFNFVNIHPFYEGNGRTSRLLMNYIQAYYELPLAIVNSEDRNLYIQSLIDANKKNDSTVFRNFMQNQYKKHLNFEIEKYQKDIRITKDKGFHLFL